MHARHLFTSFIICFCIQTAGAQKQGPPPPCIDARITGTADSLVMEFKNHGYSLVHGASLSMESEYEAAIMVNLQRSIPYVFVFVGNETSKVHELRLFDKDDQRVAFEKKKSHDKDPNILIFSYLAQDPGIHMIRPLQVNKKSKQICGQMMLFSKQLR